VQEATAKALLVDTTALTAAQQAGDVLTVNAVLMDAYNTLRVRRQDPARKGRRPGRRLGRLTTTA
jgi:L-rhamnose isomerase